jgi:DNA polymerase III epsilon subunit-like protein
LSVLAGMLSAMPSSHIDPAPMMSEPSDAQRLADRDAAVEWARAILADRNAVVVDTETTTTDNGRLIEIAAVDATGKVLLDTLVHPGAEAVHPDATAVHGLTDADLVGAPRLADIIDDITITLRDKRICAWNADYDIAVLEHECQLLISEHQYAVHTPWLERPWDDVMRWHAQWAGDFDRELGRYRFHRLNGGHRAAADCRATWDRIRFLAQAPTTQDRPDLLTLRSRRPSSFRPRLGNLEDYQEVEAVVDIDRGFGYQLVKLIGSKETKHTGAFFLARKGSINRREWIPLQGDPYVPGFQSGVAELRVVIDQLVQEAERADQAAAEYEARISDDIPDYEPR